MRRLWAAFAIAALLALAGCGGGDDGEDNGTSTASQGSGAAGQTAGSTSGEDQGDSGKAADERGGGNAGGGEGGQSPESKRAAKEAAKIETTDGIATPPGKEPAEPKAFEAPKGGDDSIQTFGERAEGSEEEEVIAAMRTFFAAMAALDYPTICDSLTASNQESLAQFLKAKGREGTCEDVLAELLLERGTVEARKAANGSVLEVRIEDENAFVLFTPEGGVPSYFVMTNEDGSWRSTGLTPGTSFDPLA